MARPYRLQIEDCLYHITSRGDDRKKIYISSYDYEKFLEYLVIAKDKFKCYIHAYCLMTNHYHLFIETTEPNLSRIMHYLNTSYTTYYNKKRNRIGHLFQGRYKSLIVDGDDYFLELTRYIHLNPVRAKMADLPQAYKWSSFNEYVTKKRNRIIDKAAIDKYYKLDPVKYKAFVMAGIDEKINLFETVYAGFILGKAEFVKKTLKDLKKQIAGNDTSYKDKLTENIPLDKIVSMVAEKLKMSKEIIYNSKKKPILAKKLSIYLAKRLSGLSNKEIGDKFDISYSAVSKAAGSIDILIREDKAVRRDANVIISHFKG